MIDTLSQVTLTDANASRIVLSLGRETSGRRYVWQVSDGPAIGSDVVAWTYPADTAAAVYADLVEYYVRAGYAPAN